MKEQLSKNESKIINTLVNNRLGGFNKEYLLSSPLPLLNFSPWKFLAPDENAIFRIHYDYASEECYVDLYDIEDKELIHSLAIYPRDVWDDFNSLTDIANYIVVEIQNAMEDLLEYV